MNIYYNLLFFIGIIFYLLILIPTIINISGSISIPFTKYLIGIDNTESIFFLATQNTNATKIEIADVIREDLKNNLRIERDVIYQDGIYASKYGDEFHKNEIRGFIVFSDKNIGNMIVWLKTKFGVLFFYLIPFSIIYALSFYSNFLISNGQEIMKVLRSYIYKK